MQNNAVNMLAYQIKVDDGMIMSQDFRHAVESLKENSAEESSALIVDALLASKRPALDFQFFFQNYEKLIPYMNDEEKVKLLKFIYQNFKKGYFDMMSELMLDIAMAIASVLSKPVARNNHLVYIHDEMMLLYENSEIRAKLQAACEKAGIKFDA